MNENYLDFLGKCVTGPWMPVCVCARIFTMPAIDVHIYI